MFRQRMARLFGMTLLPLVGCADQEAADAELPLGEQCVLGDEREPNFSGFSRDEVVIETDTGVCGSGVCLANGFQGRSSCPYGQSAGAAECWTPDGEVVEVAVEPQLLQRPPSDATICSCRCAGPGPGPFCECGKGMDCTPLSPALGVNDEAADSYCIPKGRGYDPSTFARELCDAERQNCEERMPSDKPVPEF